MPKREKEEKELKGIMAVCEPASVTVVAFSMSEGIKEVVYKVFCDHKIDARRFFHAIESQHLVANFDLFGSDVASSQLAESVEYQGPIGDYYTDDDSYLMGSTGSDHAAEAMLHMAGDETKKFVDNLALDRTEFLAES